MPTRANFPDCANSPSCKPLARIRIKRLGFYPFWLEVFAGSVDSLGMMKIELTNGTATEGSKVQFHGKAYSIIRISRGGKITISKKGSNALLQVRAIELTLSQN